MPSGRRTWKNVERRIAELAGGRRVPITGRARGDVPDVEHPLLSIEVKYRANLPRWLHGAMQQAESASDGQKLPVVVLHESGQHYEDSFVLIRLKHLLALLGEK